MNTGQDPGALWDRAGEMTNDDLTALLQRSYLPATCLSCSHVLPDRCTQAATLGHMTKLSLVGQEGIPTILWPLRVSCCGEGVGVGRAAEGSPGDPAGTPTGESPHLRRAQSLWIQLCLPLASPVGSPATSSLFPF